MKYISIIDILQMMKDRCFPNMKMAMCEPDDGDAFTLFITNHGIFLDAAMRSEDEFFEYYALEDSLYFKVNMELNFKSISYLRGCNRLIILRDDNECECVVYSDGRRISFKDFTGQFSIIEPLFRYEKNNLINVEVAFDSNRVKDDFFDCSFLTEEEELALIENNIDKFYNLIERRGLCE